MESKLGFHPKPKLKLMEQVREVLRYYHYACRTEQTCCQWIMRFIHFLAARPISGTLVSGMCGSGLRLMECVRLRIKDLSRLTASVLPAINKKTRPRGEERGSIGNDIGHGCLCS